MNVKAIVMRADRTNDVIVVPKKKIAGKTFRHNNVTYFLHADRFQVTWQRKMGVRRYYATYYYSEGIANPLPVPDFKMVDDPEVDAAIKEGKSVVAKFPKVIDNGVPGEELAGIFNPWFYRTIAPQAMNNWEKIQMILLIGAGIALLYLIWQGAQLQGQVNDLLHTVQAVKAAAPATPSPGPLA